MQRLWRRFQAWHHSEDTLVSAANSVSLVVASNTPFYPFYVWWSAGSGGMPYVWASLCSFPFFLAVPSVTRRAPMLGRVMLPIIGVLNSVFCTWLLGADSGTELFNLPCILLGGLLFRPSERRTKLAMIGLPIAAVIALHGHYGHPPHLYTDAEYRALFTMNLFSVSTLTGFLALLFAPQATQASSTHQQTDQRRCDQHANTGGNAAECGAPQHVGHGELQRP